MSKEHLNYLRRKTADEAELWAANRIEALEDKVDSLEREIDARESWKDIIKQRDALQADNARLREALERIGMASMSMYATRSDMAEHLQDISYKALAATPEQSLARIRNQVRDECAYFLEANRDLLYPEEAIRAMKEPE